MTTEQHQKFLNRLTKSADAVFAVAKYLHMRGNKVEISGMRKAPTAGEHMNYVDDGDLYIIDGDKRSRVEVKGISKNFSGMKDFPYQHLMISSEKRVNNVWEKVDYWVILSQDMRCAAMVLGKTKPLWEVISIKASNTGNWERNYVSPLSLVKWIKIKED